MNIILVALGGALGAVARYGSIQLATRFFTFPMGTMLVNIIGSLLIGILMARLSSDPAKLLLITGVLGGFTTFSAFSWDVLQLFQRGQLTMAAAYVLGSVIFSLLAVYLGYTLAK